MSDTDGTATPDGPAPHGWVAWIRVGRGAPWQRIGTGETEPAASALAMHYLQSRHLSGDICAMARGRHPSDPLTRRPAPAPGRPQERPPATGATPGPSGAAGAP
jgi:hypothetical protein